jgi:hypothetical protein
MKAAAGSATLKTTAAASNADIVRDEIPASRCHDLDVKLLSIVNSVFSENLKCDFKNDNFF